MDSPFCLPWIGKWCIQWQVADGWDQQKELPGLWMHGDIWLSVVGNRTLYELYDNKNLQVIQPSIFFLWVLDSSSHNGRTVLQFSISPSSLYRSSQIYRWCQSELIHAGRSHLGMVTGYGEQQVLSPSQAWSTHSCPSPALPSPVPALDVPGPASAFHSTGVCGKDPDFLRMHCLATLSQSALWCFFCDSVHVLPVLKKYRIGLWVFSCWQWKLLHTF